MGFCGAMTNDFIFVNPKSLGFSSPPFPDSHKSRLQLITVSSQITSSYSRDLVPLAPFPAETLNLFEPRPRQGPLPAPGQDRPGSAAGSGNARTAACGGVSRSVSLSEASYTDSHTVTSPRGRRGSQTHLVERLDHLHQHPLLRRSRHAQQPDLLPGSASRGLGNSARRGAVT